MSGLAHTALGLAALFAALRLWQAWARRGGAASWLAGVVLCAFGLDALRALRARLVDTPGGGPALEVTVGVAVAVAAVAGLRWRELAAARVEDGRGAAAGAPDEASARRRHGGEQGS